MCVSVDSYIIYLYFLIFLHKLSLFFSFLMAINIFRERERENKNIIIKYIFLLIYFSLSLSFN